MLNWQTVFICIIKIKTLEYTPYLFSEEKIGAVEAPVKKCIFYIQEIHY